MLLQLLLQTLFAMFPDWDVPVVGWRGRNPRGSSFKFRSKLRKLDMEAEDCCFSVVFLNLLQLRCHMTNLWGVLDGGMISRLM